MNAFAAGLVPGKRRGTHLDLGADTIALIGVPYLTNNTHLNLGASFNALTSLKALQLSRRACLRLALTIAGLGVIEIGAFYVNSVFALASAGGIVSPFI